MYFVVYRHREVIDGPYPRRRAAHICEDLSMLFEDTHYEIVDEDRLNILGLNPHARHAVHEDQPTL